MNSEQKSRLEAAKTQIVAIQRELSTAPSGGQAEKDRNTEDGKQLDAAVKALDSIKAT